MCFTLILSLNINKVTECTFKHYKTIGHECLKYFGKNCSWFLIVSWIIRMKLSFQEKRKARNRFPWKMSNKQLYKNDQWQKKIMSQMYEPTDTYTQTSSCLIWEGLKKHWRRGSMTCCPLSDAKSTLRSTARRVQSLLISLTWEHAQKA